MRPLTEDERIAWKQIRARPWWTLEGHRPRHTFKRHDYRTVQPACEAEHGLQCNFAGGCLGCPDTGILAAFDAKNPLPAPELADGQLWALCTRNLIFPPVHLRSLAYAATLDLCGHTPRLRARGSATPRAWDLGGLLLTDEEARALLLRDHPDPDPYWTPYRLDPGAEWTPPTPPTLPAEGQ